MERRVLPNNGHFGASCLVSLALQDSGKRSNWLTIQRKLTSLRRGKETGSDNRAFLYLYGITLPRV
jgi:hypothetical protein